MRSKFAWTVIIVLSIFSVLVSFCGCGLNDDKEAGSIETLETDWPQTRKDASRTAFSIQGPKPPLESVWQKTEESGELEVQVWGTLACSGRYLVATSKWRILCLDAVDGKTLWERGFKDGFAYYPMISGDALICGVANDGRYLEREGDPDHPDALPCEIVCLRLQTGEVIWECRIPEDMDWTDFGDSSYCIGEGKIYLVTDLGRIFVIDIKIGKILRDFTPVRDKYFIAPPVFSEGKLVMALGEKHKTTEWVYAIDINTEDVVWVRNFDYSVAPSCIHNDSVIVIPTMYQGMVYSETVPRNPPTDSSERKEIAISCLDIGTGATKWQFGLNRERPYNGLETAVSPENSSLFFGFREGSTPILYCLDFTTGQLLWKNEMTDEAGILRRPIIAGKLGVVILRASRWKSRMVVCDIQDGNVISSMWSESILSIIASGKSIYTLSIDSKGNKYETKVSCFR